VRPRHHGLDTLRGVAVLLMMIFHLVYDFWLFGLLDDHYKQGFWHALPRFIVFLFLWCVGTSLELTHGEGVRWKSFWQRFGKLAGIALIISGVTYLLFPKTWIYFGTIHCIATVSLLALPFFYLRWARIPVLLAILYAQYFAGFDIRWMGSHFPRLSMDFIPAYPWFWVTLLGMITGPWVLAKWPARANPPLEFLGKHALKIYLLHQPLFYGLAALVAWWQKLD
jgi:uncharacterized membrane protein